MATTTTFLSVPLQFLPPKQLPNAITSTNKWSQTCLPKSPFNLRCTSSPSTSSTVLEDEGSLAQSEFDPLRGSDPLLPFSGCKACGKEEIEKGCNGEGRIQGGIATVPGFGWWPIKAYRPCPEFVATGGRYRRQGQSMDEVAGFGRVEKKASVGPGEEAQSSKKKQGMKKFKR